MPNLLSKNLHFCISTMIKRRPPSAASTTTEDDRSAHLYTNSYNSLLSSPTKTQQRYSSSSSHIHQMDISTTDDVAEPDFTTIYTSDRFFFSYPGQSNSIIHSTSSSTTPLSSSSFHDVEAVETDSPDPYTDFRRSMQEVVEASGLHIGDVVRDNWNGLHQLLLCYLSLNPKDTHKFIVGAFADLVGSLMPSSSSSSFSTAAEENEC